MTFDFQFQTFSSNFRPFTLNFRRFTFQTLFPLALLICRDDQASFGFTEFLGWDVSEKPWALTSPWNEIIWAEMLRRYRPGTCRCCSRRCTPPPPSEPATACRRCCAAPCCWSPLKKHKQELHQCQFKHFNHLLKPSFQRLGNYSQVTLNHNL